MKQNGFFPTKLNQQYTHNNNSFKDKTLDIQYRNLFIRTHFYTPSQNTEFSDNNLQRILNKSKSFPKKYIVTNCITQNKEKSPIQVERSLAGKHFIFQSFKEFGKRVLTKQPL